VTLAEGRTITSSDLPAMLRSGRLLPERGGAVAASAMVDREGWSLAEVEQEHIRRVLTKYRGNATAAARQLGISRTTLWRKLREYGIPRKPDE